MTDRLYYTDAQLDHFTAVVVSITHDGHGVVLNQSAFYPTSGGQPHDLGFIGDVAVVDVMDEDVHVVHRLAIAAATTATVCRVVGGGGVGGRDAVRQQQQ